MGEVGRLGFLSARAWLDKRNVDGKRHVWLAHDCTEGRDVSMLPWPTWQSDGLRVTPSVSCDGCGLHAFVDIGPPDDDYRCSSTSRVDGRRCEEMDGHGPEHQAGMFMWGVYERGEHCG